MRRALPLLAAGAALAAVLSANATTTTGLHGVVMRGPTQPVCRVGTPCAAPAAGVVITFVRNGVTHSVKTDAHGRYRVGLVAGRYALRIPGARFGFAPHVVTVAADRLGATNIKIDTGIR